MTFEDTIHKLLDETEEIEVMACRAYPENGNAIGIRRHTIYDETMKDPMIGNVSFMICGEVLKGLGSTNCEVITNLEDLVYSSNDSMFVELRAIAMPELRNTTELGYYKILKMEFIENFIEDILHAARLYLKRKT